MCRCNVRRWATYLMLLSVSLMPSEMAMSADRPVVVVSTTLIASALADLGVTQAKVVLLVPPDACPGHDDLTPAEAASIRQANLVITHAFQKDLRTLLQPRVPAVTTWITLEDRPSLTRPSDYRAAAESLLKALSDLWPSRAVSMKTSWTRQNRRIREAEKAWTARLQSRSGAPLPPVLSAYRQETFVRSWGFPVIGVFDPPQRLSLREIGQLLQRAKASGVVAVIANRQSGDREAKVLAAKLGVPVITLSNFPGVGEGYQTLLQTNAEALSHVAGR